MPNHVGQRHRTDPIVWAARASKELMFCDQARYERDELHVLLLYVPAIKDDQI